MIAVSVKDSPDVRCRMCQNAVREPPERSRHGDGEPQGYRQGGARWNQETWALRQCHDSSVYIIDAIESSLSRDSYDSASQFEIESSLSRDSYDSASQSTSKAL